MKYILISIFILFFVAANSQHSNSALFDASGDSYIDMGKAAKLNNYDLLADSNQLTITLWVKWGNKDKPDIGNWANLITAADTSGSGDNGVWWIQHNSNNTKFEFALTTSGRTFIQSTTNPVEGIWYHIACVYDGSNMKLYIDGVEEAHSSKSGDIAAFHANSKLNIGRWPNESNDYRKFDGNIDEVSIWNIALNKTQINEIKDNPESITGTTYNANGILGYWNFDDQQAIDLSDNNNNGIIGTGTTLPIELISFNAEINNNSVELNWATATELNNDYFIIERATDISTENSNWNQIDQTSGAGTTNTISEYILIDNDIDANEETYYYRLKQVDYDGKFTYSDIVAVSIKISKEISVYPNPSIGIFKVSGLSDNTYNSVEVYNSVGQMIMKTEGTQELVIDITDQASGFYFIKSGTSTIRVIKQ